MSAKTEPPTTFTCYRRDGVALRLRDLIGQGGEGAVFAVDDGTVAKVYKVAASPEKAHKIEEMTASQTSALCKFSAWPIEPLYARHKGPLVGLLMKRVTGYREIHELYSPKSRKTYFPEANWPFLIHVAANVAWTFAVLHEHGCVIGDVNHGNVLVSGQGTTFLIDCDSFQFQRDGKTFICEVGVPTYTPPELQGSTFKGVIRTANHDNFGLAVLVFHLLFMGRHPFAGRFSGRGDMPIDKAIEEHRFAFSCNASALLMAPPPNSLTLGALTPELQNLFEKAFSAPATTPKRPSAKEWFDSLRALRQELKQCAINPAHHFFRNAQQCPWCGIEAATGVILFGLITVSAGAGTFDIKFVWMQINSVGKPGPPSALPTLDEIIRDLSPPEEVRAAGHTRRKRQFAGFAVVIAGIVFLFAAYQAALSASFRISVPGAAAFWLFIISIVVGVHVGKYDDGGLRQKIAYRLSSAQQKRRSIVELWNREATSTRFDECLNRLTKQHKEYTELPSIKQQKLNQLERNRYAHQLQKFLERQFIRPGEISKIGQGRVDTLRSYGIETAGDITRAALDNVPGFGEVLKGNLLGWRAFIEGRFVFDPNKRIDPEDIRAIEREITGKRVQIEKNLILGLSELKRTTAEIDLARKNLSIEYKNVLKEEAQATVDQRAS